jgi:SpoVK/Ycf46/Vps4 family AAA+-type ATPase
MKPDPSVIAAMRAAVDADPDNGPLRLHLARLLLDSGDASGALMECGRVAFAAPENVDALDLAAQAADAAGETKRAAAYRTMRKALATDSDKGLPSGETTAIDKGSPEPKPTAARSGRDAPVRLEVIRGGKETTEEIDVEPPSVRLGDVGGMEKVKRRLHTAFLGPLANPALLRAFGKSLRGGLLLYGPPGCGKTFIARAVAGELGARFIAVGLHDVLDMWLGQSQKNLHAIFQNARRVAPCVLFFDELDALGRKRSEARSTGTRDVVIQLLAELDSFGSDNEGVFVLAATNHPWDVDSALRRPGRLDRTLLVLPPDEDARQAILRYHLTGRPLEAIDYASIAKRTKYFSGADLAHVCETATEYALEDSIALGAPRPIRMADLERATREVSPSTLEWLNISRNYAQFANEAGVYDELIEYLREEGMA